MARVKLQFKRSPSPHTINNGGRNSCIKVCCSTLIENYYIYFLVTSNGQADEDSFEFDMIVGKIEEILIGMPITAAKNILFLT